MSLGQIRKNKVFAFQKVSLHFSESSAELSATISYEHTHYERKVPLCRSQAVSGLRPLLPHAILCLLLRPTK